MENNEDNTLSRIVSFIEKHQNAKIKIDGVEFIVATPTLIKPIAGLQLGEFRLELIFSGKIDDVETIK